MDLADSSSAAARLGEQIDSKRAKRVTCSLSVMQLHSPSAHATPNKQNLDEDAFQQL